MIARQMGLEVTVVDHSRVSPKRELVERLGATYHAVAPERLHVSADVVMECTGVPSLIQTAIEKTANGGVTCLTGVSPVGGSLSLDLGAIGRSMVLSNTAVIGSVNANRHHYESAAETLVKADQNWLDALITRRVPLEDFEQALARTEHDVKVVLDLA